MANFATLLSTIAANIYTNNNNEIDADDLKGVLNTMVQELGQAGYIFAGVAVPSTSPGTPDSNVFYIAGKGTYSNFGSTVVGDGQIGVFAYNGSWSYNVLDTGAWFDVDVYPAEAALEMTFYDGSHPDGETIKINANVSNLGNSKLEAISAWWAAQKERKINLIAGYTIDFDSLDASSPSSLGVFKAIQAGQIIDSYTNATSLIFGTDGGQSVTINKSQLPYTATANLINVKSASGTLSNVSIKVRGTLENMPSYININEIANHPAAYANAAAALADVPEIYRRKGTKVVYYDDDTQLWIEMLCYDDAGGANWWTDVDNNWAIEGPIATKLATATGGQQIQIAGEKRGNLDDVLNVNVWNEQIYEYESKADARAAVPANKRKLGGVITYLIDGMWYTEQFIGSSTSTWTTTESDWKVLGPVSVSQNTLSIGGNYAGEMSTTYDVTLHNSGATFASLEALLSDANLDTLIPIAVRKSGMSIKFVQSSDNKYVHYNLLANSFTIDTTQWAIDDDGVYIENSEFIYIKRDSQNRILWAIKEDGGIFYGAGVPRQIVKYIQTKIEEYNGDAIIEFLNGIEENDKTLQQLLNEKVDKTTGKSLIDSNFASEIPEILSTTSTSEYMQLELDSDKKILAGRYRNGTKVENMPVKTPSFENSYLKNSEWVKLERDKDGKILYGIKTDGGLYINDTNILEKVITNSKDIEELKEFNIKIAETKKTYYSLTKQIAIYTKTDKVHPYNYVVNNFYDKVLTYPDGTIFYAGPEGNTIKRILPNGTTSTLLTLEGASGAYQGVWMDSNNNIFVSPSFSSNEETKTGIWKLPFGEDTFVQVLSLYNPQSDVPSESTPNRNRIWTWTEDREGNLYAGVYGNPFCPYIYKSTDDGDSWFFLTDMSEFVPSGIHIHFIEYNKYDDCLYCTVGEVNKLLKSADGGVTWTDLNVRLDPMKSCSICIVDDGIVLGSDYGYYGMLYKVYPDGSYRTTTKFWANAIFAIRQSDVTGWLYAIGVIDAAVLSTDWYPPVEALSDATVLQNWINSNPQHLTEWQKYHNDMLNIYPDDAIRPQHTAVLVSRDKGETWEILYRHPYQARGYISYFRNGEAACCFDDSKTLIISEGVHPYNNSGINIDNTILNKLNN